MAEFMTVIFSMPIITGVYNMLHTREFDVNGQKIILGHDRETNIRYLVQSENAVFPVYGVNFMVFVEGENFISLDTGKGELVLFSDVENPAEIVAELKSIFWIE